MAERKKLDCEHKREYFTSCDCIAEKVKAEGNQFISFDEQNLKGNMRSRFQVNYFRVSIFKTIPDLFDLGIKPGVYYAVFVFNQWRGKKRLL